ncbi:HlyD family efflux transporter periplasmic adaptor subunit [Candidatus Berkiella cookevillensis]|uniref:Colicin V secretion protein CvaA n=1 Tax=Candidatus Berkiella cookevillensis TaxID=437022 RepID=A0A0Q9YCK5_9GAMM|nr:HlyD family efflux transporter periplasmic adaptor subunit [Candidatus Berkiella cookevillensis]MCS5708079.1 HlyD family efflux transporter periplasmic adaptor subunit [Candidatus Berkiella cookevillensis]
MSSLFRKEALEHSKNRLYGDVILLQPLSISVLVATVVIVCSLIIAMLFWGTYARKETVRGYVVPDKGIVKVYAPNPGTIYEVHVEEGQDVIEGQTLITVISERSVQGGSDVDSMLLKELEVSKEHQLKRIIAEKSLLTSETERAQNTINGIEKELFQIEESLKTQQQRLAILQTRLEGAEKLLKQKSMSENEYQKYLEEMLIQKQQLQDLERGKANKENALIQAKVEILQLPIRVESRINEIEDVISELNQRMAEVQGRKVYEIRAPIAGKVTALQAREGQWQSNIPLLAIFPNDAKMQVELFVPTRAIGFIEDDQTVRIRFDAFPYQRFGIFEGKVATVSKHVLLPSELPVPLELKEPVYRVTVELDAQFVTAYGKELPLQAGMALEADIILDRQTLFDWILDPLFSLKGRF